MHWIIPIVLITLGLVVTLSIAIEFAKVALRRIIRKRRLRRQSPAIHALGLDKNGKRAWEYSRH